MKRWAPLIVALVAVGGAGWFLGNQRRAPAALNYGTLPFFSGTAVTTERVRTFRSDELKGSWWVAGFVYSTCGDTCPTILTQMSGLQASAPAHLRFIAFTVDPQMDTDAALQALAKQHKADPKRWVFLRMKEADFSTLFTKGFKIGVVSDPDGLSITHSSKLVLVDPQGVIRGYFDGLTKEGSQQLIEMVRENKSV